MHWKVNNFHFDHFSFPFPLFPNALLALLCVYVYMKVICLWSTHFFSGDPPDIDEGVFVPRPDPVTPGNKTVDVATPVYVLDGDDVTIVCRIASGTHPITIMWLRNGVEVASFRNISAITITNVNANVDNRAMYMCRAENAIGFDEETTILFPEGKHALPLQYMESHF